MIEFIVSLFLFLWYDEDENLDLTDTPESAEYAEAQTNEYIAWEKRRGKGKKGRKV